MTTSSSSCIIKPGTGVEIMRFVPPAETDIVSKRQERGEHTQTRENRADPAGRGAGQGPADMAEIAREEADRILQKARQMAEDILKEAGVQAEQLKKNAMEAGCKEGFEAGYQSGMERADSEQADFFRQKEEEFRRDMEQALASIEQAKEKNLRNYLEELKDCSVAIAEKVIHISLRSSGEVIKRMLIAETEKLRKAAWVKIYMEKTDYDMMIQADADVVSELARLSDNIKFVVMDKESSGNCIIEMPDEIVDISVDTQMENMREILENIRF